jgi:hypothetical protein
VFNQRVYIASASGCDFGAYRGWVAAYDTTSLQPTNWFAIALPGCEAGIWHTSRVVVDEETGNGESQYNAYKTYGNAIVKLDCSGSLLDYFVPFDSLQMSTTDNDLSSGGVTLVKAGGVKRVISVSNG